MTRSALDGEDPDRLYTVTGGRSSADDIDLDLVTLIVRESEPSAGMQSEHVRILEIAAKPTSVVELSSYLALPVSVTKILLADLLATGKVSARHPSSAQAAGRTSDSEFLKKVLVGLRNL
ncbi:MULTISPECIES: DUF742 domain-containing protein [unclassified Amycolatopsis]|uniref:DUF742 domain-containing protein n=1 Tax=unclassified Amycolatopsis TaxID=2618356 RepID=UPI002E241812|nr:MULTISPECIES: DUF742 domain-containing protein [unclassified Amycolatopsis]